MSQNPNFNNVQKEGGLFQPGSLRLNRINQTTAEKTAEFLWLIGGYTGLFEDTDFSIPQQINTEKFVNIFRRIDQEKRRLKLDPASDADIALIYFDRLKAEEEQNALNRSNTSPLDDSYYQDLRSQLEALNSQEN